RLGLVQGDKVLDVSAALDVLPAVRWPFPLGDQLIANLPRVLERVRQVAADAPVRKISEVRLLSPVANPSKIVAAPVNYRLHQIESQADKGINFGQDIKDISHYGAFLKSNSSLVGVSEGVALRKTDRRNDHEAELAVIIGKHADKVSYDQALDYVAGYSIALDMTVRGPEDRSLRKSVDTYSVLGPYLVTKDEVPDPNNLNFWLTVNNEPRQKANTKDLIFNVQKLIEYVTGFYALLPGDIIMTGTPEGVGPVKAGDLIISEFEQIGRIEVKVRNA
ncbi:MAG: fumarylacetoacetate hydrolase family protein, partial [Alphaproteobacteria bacterium]